MNKLLRCLCAALFVACVSLSNVGCAENTGCAKECCSKQCTPECKKTCPHKDAKPCPPTCPKAQAQQKAAQTDKQ